MGEEGPGDGRGFGDAYGDIDRAGADVGQALDVNVPMLESGGKAFVLENVLKSGGTVLINADPCAVAEGVAPGPEFIEACNEILANGAGNKTGFVQDPVEFVREAVQSVGAGVKEPLGPPAHGFMVV